jgi:hypothetical protein
MVVLVPVPVVVVPPGVRVRVHVPEEGRPLSTTLPVRIVHVGCVIVPTTGAVGAPGTGLITTGGDDNGEVHPAELVTVQVYVPGARPQTVLLVPVQPAVITTDEPVGCIVSV